MKLPGWVAATLAAGLLFSSLPVAPAAAAPIATAAPAPLAAPKPNWKLALQQVDQSTSVRVTVDPSVLAKASKVTLTAKLKYGRTTTRSVSCSQSLAKLVAGAFTCNLKDYGKWSITARFYQGRKKVRTNSAVSLGVFADEYIIAPLAGTMPGTLFTSSLWGENSIRGAGAQPIPVIARLTRAHQWDWKKLPEGVRALPYLTTKQAAKRTTMNSYKAPAIAPIKAYIKELRKLNKKSVFHLYVNDYTAHLVHNLLYANQIPEQNYTITFLSDGNHSYAQFARNYAGKDPAAVHQKLIASWNRAKEKAYRDGKPHLSAPKARAAIYAAVDTEPSATWWLTNPDLLNQTGQPNAFADQARQNPKVVKAVLKDKLLAVQAEGDQAVREFKRLYRFNDAYFADAIKAGRKVMLFLGTKLDGREQDFADYAGFTVKRYGKKYGYYYKGHPGTPTENHPAKQKELKKLGIVDVQSSVPAELILFFNPNISMSGYGSSTWDAVPAINPDMAEGLFGITKTDGSASASYAGIIKWYMTPKPGSGPVSKLPGDFLVEFSDPVSAAKGYDIALWGSKKKTITYYRLVDGKYTRVT